ncbi:PP2C family protein-serine/threonine phosphatase [Gordonia crocea]|uniref:Serine/threonine protein phosphatase PstP n=1 Tax=Gordonia crocea TaxID=589162 RepID=A0A7M3SUA1_9ACTN|nr:PP2C family serine/threonine-protein phosphatase [Gordonia crocea]GED96225.1 putative serine/threonine phosphatase Ppp [Gordonia crocea]
MTLVLEYVARSDRGLVRSNNEDSVYAGPRLLALADGMGGHAAGEVASQLVIQAMQPLDDDEPGGDILGLLHRAMDLGNDAIAAQVDANPELDGMGTTLTALLFSGTRVGLCHVGDSRAYLFRDGEVSQITRDDTFVQALVDEGRISADQAHTHPQRSLIMRALTGTEVDPTLTMREARAGDRYLLCSDGLSDVVSEETIGDTLGSVESLSACADRLIELALRSGGPDNVTVVLADVVDTEYGESRPILGGAAGGDGEAVYTPDPSSAAGRAAALRPSPEPAKPVAVSLEEEQPTRPKRRWRRWVTLAVIALLIATVAVATLITRSKLDANHFLQVDDGNIVVYRGSPDPVFWFTLNSPAERVCIDDLAAEHPKITFVADQTAACNPLPVAALAELDRNAVREHKVRNLSLDDMHERVRGLMLLPMCRPATPPAPAPAPPPEQPQPAPPAPTVTDGPCRGAR